MHDFTLYDNVTQSYQLHCYRWATRLGDVPVVPYVLHHHKPHGVDVADGGTGPLSLHRRLPSFARSPLLQSSSGEADHRCDARNNRTLLRTELRTLPMGAPSGRRVLVPLQRIRHGVTQGLQLLAVRSRVEGGAVHSTHCTQYATHTSDEGGKPPASQPTIWGTEGVFRPRRG